MLTALHAMVYSDDPSATRRFFAEVLRRPFVSEGARGDAGVGGAGTGGTDPSDWLIFRTGPSELGVHPTSEGEWNSPRHHSISLMCDDLDATVAELTGRGATFTGEPREFGYGRGVLLKVPGADDILLYEPAHATAYDMVDEGAADQGAADHRHCDHGHGDHGHDDHGEASPARMPVTESEWEQHYTAAAIWSGNPNGALVAEVADLSAGRAVDVGCGEGADAVWLATQGWTVTAFDVADSALDRGRSAAEALGVSVDWLRAGLLSADLPAGAFDLVTACYPALLRTPEALAEQALVGLVAPGGRLLVLAHADLDREQSLAHGFDLDDYVALDDVRAVLPDDWTVEVDGRRDRHLETGAGAGHHADLVFVARRPQESA